MNDEFLAPKLSITTLDKYYHRKAILKALTSALEKFSGDLLDIGCGKMPYRNFILDHSEVKSYVGLDIETAIEYDKNVKPDFAWDGVSMPFDNESFHCAFATEVLEHCPYPNVTLAEVYRVLKPRAVFFFTVPFLWNLHETPHDHYRYTPFSLQKHLNDTGFTDVSFYSFGGWHASMAQMMGLWLRRAPMNKRTRKALSMLAMPFYKKLISAKFNPADFRGGTMITGLYGFAYKRNS